MNKHHHVTRGMMPRLAAYAAAPVAAAAIAAAAGVPAASAAPGRAVLRVPCTASTFDVFSATAGEVCYEGTGTALLNIPNVYRITTGVNTGSIRVAPIAPPVKVIPFRPHQTIAFPLAQRVRLITLTITST